MSLSKNSKTLNYPNSPDGEDLLPKLALLAKPTALTALTASTVDVLLWSHPKGYLATIGRFVHVSWPIFGAVGTFVVASNLAGSIRKKDDQYNWFIGGASAGLIAGLWRRSFAIGFFAAALGGALGAGKKYCVVNNYPFFLPEHYTVQYGGLRSVRQDWTVTREPARNWTTGEGN